MYLIVVYRLNDCTIFGMAGVGAESISAPVSLAYMDRADMESAPTDLRTKQGQDIKTDGEPTSICIFSNRQLDP